MSRFAARWFPLMLFALVAACSPVRFVSGYDEQSDRELTSLYADTTAFADRMIALSGTPEGRFDANRDFTPRQADGCRR